MLCSKLHCQKILNQTLLLYERTSVTPHEDHAAVETERHLKIPFPGTIYIYIYLYIHIYIFIYIYIYIYIRI